ncbi:hypothetical protein [Roseivirga spongicola]|uniref:hypothetical protein n=1 Tax=Roseivirga spongicola TaxID=333140 RepID=UPI002AC9CF89|nr:hypothetical protein [Roseivirga spongicola]WPZ08742.1 hypothetical protein T7867_10780 [Roseivirga spongicola]
MIQWIKDNWPASRKRVESVNAETVKNFGKIMNERASRLRLANSIVDTLDSAIPAVKLEASFTKKRVDLLETALIDLWQQLNPSKYKQGETVRGWTIAKLTVDTSQLPELTYQYTVEKDDETRVLQELTKETLA